MATPNASPASTQPTKPAAAKRKPKPRTAAKAATRTTARSTSASSTRPTTRTERAQQLAERAVLIPVGAALEARDRVVGTVGELVTTTRSRTALERQLKRFERRGGTARTQLEREVRRSRTRLEREARNARRGFERQRTQARKTLGDNVESLSDRVPNVVQNGLNTGKKFVNGAQDRISKVA
jgi:hypothetical protein